MEAVVNTVALKMYAATSAAAAVAATFNFCLAALAAVVAAFSFL